MKEKKKLLIVEDEKDIVFILKQGLEEYEVVEANNGLEALEKLKESRPDLILLDIMMPELNGADFNKKLKENPQYSSIPVIVITGRGDLKGIFSEEGANRVDGILEKPFTLEVLKEAIEEIIG